MRAINGAVESYPDEVALKKICNDLQLPLNIGINARGKSRLDGKLREYNRAANHQRWLILRDLDGDAPCAGMLCQNLLPAPAPFMCLRVAVRSLEAWMLADADMFAQFFRIRQSAVPANPESLCNPKETLLGLVRRSRSSDMRADMLPRPGSGAREGPAYATQLATYIHEAWRPAVAAAVAPSLRRCLERLQACRQCTTTAPRRA